MFICLSGSIYLVCAVFSDEMQRDYWYVLSFQMKCKEIIGYFQKGSQDIFSFARTHICKLIYYVLLYWGQLFGVNCHFVCEFICFIIFTLLSCLNSLHEDLVYFMYNYCRAFYNMKCLIKSSLLYLYIFTLGI